MKQEKAREFFSGYYEGTLDPSLRQAFEHALNSDAAIRSDYEGFAHTLDDLVFLRSEQIEAPVLLSDRIATRLEQAEVQRNRQTWSPRNWLIGLGLAGVAAVVLVGGAMSFGNRDRNAMATTIVSPTNESESLTVNSVQGEVTCRVRVEAKRTITVSLANGKILRQIEAQGRDVVIPLENLNPGAVVFRVEVLGEGTSKLVAVPGSTFKKGTTGSGSLTDLAAAVADRYHSPIVIEAAAGRKSVTWNFGPDAIASINQALRGTGLSVEQHANEMLSISDR